MTFGFRPTSQTDSAAISEFLGRVLELRAEAALLDPGHMRWKYWTARPDWEGSRSFIAHHRGAIVAHLAVWPMRVRSTGQEVTALHAIDWAADRRCPGAGTWLMRQMAARVRMMVATGGSEIGRGILPVIGFRPHSALYQFAYPLRPLGQALSATNRNLKLPARVLRNAFWRLSRPLSLPGGWSAMSLAAEEVPQGLWPQPSSATAVTARDTGFYRYFLDSPSAPHALYGLYKNGELAGYFCLALATHAARIADLWLPSGDVEDWCAGFRTAAMVAAREERIYIVSAFASTALGKEGLSRAGFLIRERATVSLLGDAKILEGRELHLQMLDSDASFLSGEAVS